MTANDPSAVLNAVICGVIVIVLMFYRRGDTTPSDFVTGLCHGAAGICQRPFQFVFGLYESSHWLVVMVNIISAPLCCGLAVMWRVWSMH